MDPGQKSVVLILARELATNLATPMFLVDADGRLVFYNEAAEPIVGRPFAEVGEMDAGEWAALLKPTSTTGEPLSRAQIAPGVALLERRPAHGSIAITGLDGVPRQIEITAYPLYRRADEFSGAVGIFWLENEG